MAEDNNVSLVIQIHHVPRPKVAKKEEEKKKKEGGRNIESLPSNTSGRSGNRKRMEKKGKKKGGKREGVSTNYLGRLFFINVRYQEEVLLKEKRGGKKRKKKGEKGGRERTGRKRSLPTSTTRDPGLAGAVMSVGKGLKKKKREKEKGGGGGEKWMASPLCL